MARPVSELLRVLSDFAAEHGSMGLAKEALEASEKRQFIQLVSTGPRLKALDNHGTVWAAYPNQDWEEIQGSDGMVAPEVRWEPFAAINSDLSDMSIYP